MGKDPPGFHEFAATRGAALFRTAWLLCGDRHLAEDLVQTTLGKLYVSWRRVRRADNPVAYARTVLMRTYLSHFRKLSNSETPWLRLPEVAAAGADQELRVTLLNGLALLPAQDRAVLILRYWEGPAVRLASAAEVLTMAARTLETRPWAMPRPNLWWYVKTVETQTQMLWDAPVLLPPATQAALYRVLAAIPGVQLDRNVRDGAGRPAIALSRGFGEQYLLDPATYEMVARRTINTGRNAPIAKRTGTPDPRSNTPIGTVIYDLTRITNKLVNHPGRH